MDLPDPSRLAEHLRPVRMSSDLLSASDLDSSPFVRSIPSSPYLGATSTPGTNHVSRDGDTAQSDALVEKLEKLELPEPEVLQEGSQRDEADKERIAKELGDVMSTLNLPDPEYITRASMRAQGAKTPEPM